MKALLIRTDKGLRGATPEDHATWTKFRRKLETLQPRKWLRLEFSSPRNGKHHGKFFALLQLIAENSEIYNTTEKALIAVKLCAGHFEPAVHPVTGELIQVPKSIAFESMDQEAFEAFYTAAVDAVLQHILPHIDRDKADRLLDMIAEGWL